VRPFLAATAFLTRIPVGKTTVFDAEDVAHSAGWFPAIGVSLGAVYCGIAAVLKPHLPAGVIAVLLILVDALATGALHFDGLADTADGFGGGKDRADVLRVMRDHAIGSYGGLALAIAVALKVMAYDALLNRPDWMAALIVTPALGRWSILLLTATLTYARAAIKSAAPGRVASETSAPSCRAAVAPQLSVVEGIGKSALVFGTLIMAVALGATMSARSWIAAAVVMAVTACFGWYCRRRIAGITGDTLGASVQLSESAALLTFLWVGFSR